MEQSLQNKILLYQNILKKVKNYTELIEYNEWPIETVDKSLDEIRENLSNFNI